MRLQLTAKARKDLKRLPQNEAKKVDKKLRRLMDYPYTGKKLKGELSRIYSLRIWPYRIFYGVEEDIITIFKIEHRQSAYKP